MFTLIIAGNRACPTTRSPNGIDLMDENYGRGVLACLLKQITHTAGSRSDEEFDKVGGARTEERHSCLSGDCTRQQGLAGTRWANQQDTPGDMRSELDVALRVTQEVDHLTQFRLGLINACHIPEGCLWTFFLVKLGTAASNAKESASLHILHLTHPPQAHHAEVEQQEQGQRVQEQSQRRLPPGRLHNLRIDLDPLFLEQGQQIGITCCRDKCGKVGRCHRAVCSPGWLRSWRLADRGFEGACDGIIAVDRHTCYVALLHLLQEATVRQVNRCRWRAQETEEKWTIK